MKKTRLLLNSFASLFIFLASSPAVAAPIPHGAIFWISYHSKEQTPLQKTTATKLAKRIEKLGYTAQIYSHGEIEQIESNDPISIPTAIIDISNGNKPKLQPSLSAVPFQTLRDAGSPSDDQALTLGLEPHSLGVLYDETLLKEYRDTQKSEDYRAEIQVRRFNRLSLETKTWLLSWFNIRTEKKDQARIDEEVREALKQHDLYFGSAESYAMKSSFVRVAANLSRKLKRKSIIILPTPNNEREYLKVVFPNPDQETESRNATMETEQKPRTPRNIKQCGLEKPLPLGFWNFFPPEQPPHPESRAQVALIPEPSYAEFQTLLSMSRYTLVDNARTLEDAISSGIPFLYAASDREEMLQTQIHERIYSRNVVYLVDTFKTSHESELPYRWTQTASDQLSRMKTSDLAGFFESLHRLHIRDRNLVLLLQSILDQKLH